MEHLFNLIFDNLWIVIILFGIVSSLFGGDKKQRKQKPFSETTRMPTMTQAKPAEQKQVLQKQAAKKIQDAAAKVKESQPAKEELSSAQAYLAEKAALLQKQSERLPQKTLDISKPVSAEKKTQGTFSQNEVVNGIIMAEILGAPRAKKPYARSRR
ncbi:MAG: hypothetical protein ACI4XS_13340 [Bacillus sp. (in: firmicutes)]